MSLLILISKILKNLKFGEYILHKASYSLKYGSIYMKLKVFWYLLKMYAKHVSKWRWLFYISWMMIRYAKSKCILLPKLGQPLEKTTIPLTKNPPKLVFISYLETWDNFSWDIFTIDLFLWLHLQIIRGFSSIVGFLKTLFY